MSVTDGLLGTTEIVLIHHRDCGMLTFDGEELKDQLEQEAGTRPTFSFESFGDVDTNIRQSVARVRADPFLPHKNVRGFAFDVATGKLDEVT